MIEFDPLILSRIQFAFTLSFHILFPTLTIGLAGYIIFWEILWLRTGEAKYYHLCRFWSKIFALAFGMGVISGIVLSFEFGTNFSYFSKFAGNILGPLMSYEVLTAFFLEAGFLGIMLFGWNRVSKGVHLFSSVMVGLGTTISAFWILSASSWMHTPAGYKIINNVLYPADWIEIIFNPSFGYRFLHMLVASYLTTTFLIAGTAAWWLLKKKDTDIARHVFSLTMAAALILMSLQMLLGDLHGLNTYEHQPLKVAAIEGRWETERGVPLTIFALPDQEAEINRYAIEIPKLGSIILRHEIEGEVIGLKTVPKEQRPYVPVVFFSFRIMFGIGLLFMGTAIFALFLRMRKTLYSNGKFMKWCILISPLGFIAVIAGWFTTEVGRQPWVIYNLLLTKDAVSKLNPEAVMISLFVFLVLYFILLSFFIYYFIRLIKNGLVLVAVTEPADKVTAWLEKE